MVSIVRSMVALCVVGCGGAQAQSHDRDADGQVIQGSSDSLAQDGAAGASGLVGPAGADGKDGAPGADGKDGVDGANGFDGEDGANGKDGVDATDDGLPHPRYILRDKDGTVVEADVYPYQLGEKRVKFASSITPDCMHVAALGPMMLAMTYSPATGGFCTISPFAPTTWDSWRALDPFFLDDECEGATYTRNGADTPTPMVVGVLYYADGTPDFSGVTTFHRWRNDTCTEFTNDSGVDLWAFKQVPDAVVNALPNAPYTIEMAY